MFCGKLQRMVLAELFKVFFIALFALTVLILMAGVISEAMKNGFTVMQIVTMIPLLLPSMLPYTVPTTTLFATCLVYGRLSADNEILAMKAAGIHIVHIIWPALLLGILTSAATMFLYLDAIPYTSFLMKSALTGDLEEVLYATLRRDGCIRHAKMNYEIDVKGVQGRTLQDVIFKRRSTDGHSFDMIARAREAEMRVDLGQKQILIDMHQCQVVQHNTVGILDETIWPVDIPGFLLSNQAKTRASDMSWLELFAYDESIETEKDHIQHEIDLHQKQIERGKAQPHFAQHVRHLSNEFNVREGQLSAIHCEWHIRPAFSLSCFCFALIACPVAIWFSKSDYLSAFVTCFLPIVTVYYPLMLCTINLAHAGKMAPWLCIYIADGVLLIAGAALFHRLSRA